MSQFHYSLNDRLYFQTFQWSNNDANVNFLLTVTLITLFSHHHNTAPFRNHCTNNQSWFEIPKADCLSANYFDKSKSCHCHFKMPRIQTRPNAFRLKLCQTSRARKIFLFFLTAFFQIEPTLYVVLK